MTSRYIACPFLIKNWEKLKINFNQTRLFDDETNTRVKVKQSQTTEEWYDVFLWKIALNYY